MQKDFTFHPSNQKGLSSLINSTQREKERTFEEDYTKKTDDFFLTFNK